MIFTENENRMYQIMEALYDSGIPISFKGSMVLKAALQELGYNDNIRGTKDIDGNWFSDDVIKTEDIVQSINQVFDEKGLGYYTRAFREHSEKKAAGLYVLNKSTDETLFSMDIDVNRPQPMTKIYAINNIKFSGVVPEQIIADKVFVASSKKVFRRVKDLLDLYYLSSVVSFEKDKILELINGNNRLLGDFSNFLFRANDIQHAYNKFSVPGKVEKPPFADVYSVVKEYIQEFFPEISKDVHQVTTIDDLKVLYPIIHSEDKLKLNEVKSLGEYYYKLGSLFGDGFLTLKEIDRKLIIEMLHDGHSKSRIKTLYTNINEHRGLSIEQCSHIKELLHDKPIVDLQKTLAKADPKAF